jgi:zinc transporter ZupT
MTTAGAWRETYRGGSAEAERLEFQRLAQEIMDVQLAEQQHAKASAVRRAFHAKPVFATTDASLRIVDDLPEQLRAGWVQPGREYRTIVRLSNASGVPESDASKDLRGIALRVEVSGEEQHDLLATNFPVSHARNAEQFVAFAKAFPGGAPSIPGVFGLVFKFGLGEFFRMLSNISQGRRESRSLALETFWSRAAYRWGPVLAVRFLLRPETGAAPATSPAPGDAQFLSTELRGRLAKGDVRYTLCVQPFVDEKTTPIEDTAVEWTERVSPPVPVAVLTIPKQEYGAEARANAQTIDELSFNPWNTTDEFRPLGNLNRARKAVYDASSAHRLGYRWVTKPPLRNVIFGALARSTFALINTFVEWHRLPSQLGLLNLDAFRHTLRAKNLIDTDIAEVPPKTRAVPPPIGEEARSVRTYDGTFNDLSAPKMGSVDATFGRNMKPVYRPDLFDTPNPIVVSEELLKRETFIPATSLNILAAAWIQFQVHDWVDHKRYPLDGEHDVHIPLPPGRTVRNLVGGPDEPEMRLAGNLELEGSLDGAPIFGNNASHWWDSSEVYGMTKEANLTFRDGAKLRLPNGYLPDDVNGLTLTGFNFSWWLGLSAMHTLFAREHNLLCDELRSHYKTWDDERVFQTARLIVTALIAKIHTIEWTPAILATKTIDIALNSNWGGPPKDWLTQLGLWLVDTHSMTGILKTMPDHQSAPYSLTEDFVTVYRMHPLIPDDYTFYRCEDGREIGNTSFDQIQGLKTDGFMRDTGLNNVLYSFGIANPGAIVLHNFPEGLRRLVRNDHKEIVDLAVADIVRTRRRGVPRYNDFREGLHKPRIKRWEDLTANPESVRRLKEVYGNTDMVDTVVGLLGETPPEGFGFSDTAFRVFILSASRRLQSDRFLTVDFRPEIYSPFGMDWIANNGMTSLILRHCPELSAVLPRTASAFVPWRSIVPADFGRA